MTNIIDVNSLRFYSPFP